MAKLHTSCNEPLLSEDGAALVVSGTDEAVPINRIRIEARHRKDLGDVDALAKSIAEVGLLSPVAVTPDLLLIAGHRRIEAMRRLGYSEVPVRVIHTIDDVLDVHRAERDENTCRKDFLASEAVAIGRTIEAIERERARERQESGLKQNAVRSGKLPERAKGDTRDKVGEAVGLSGKTYEKAKKVAEAAEEQPDVFGDLPDLMDTASVDRAFRELKKRTAPPPPPLPAGEYDVILADPPWQYDFAETDSRHLDNQYPTSSVEDICAMVPPAAEKAVLYLWGTAPKLREALQVMDAWGFKYVTHAIWDKEKIGMGYWFRGQHELILVGTRGGFSPPEPAHRISSVIREARGVHSRKPEAIHELIEQAFPHSRKLEMFARAPRDGWKVFGNEVARAA